ncbi:MAG: hypothetical protein K9M15_00005, partial [Candidatus Marinimicrobia bacterium]|nr:hypothetical protein [Candidatus Neomarinimicrobiota bacterium]
LLEAGLTYYDRWRGQEDIKDLAQSLEDYDKAVYELMANDKVGGSTPQETLNLFIEAVEAGDYEMASRYFVVDKQEKWAEDLSMAENVEDLLSYLKESMSSPGSYSSDRKTFSVHDPILVSFTLYPSGNWKIEEI